MASQYRSVVVLQRYLNHGIYYSPILAFAFRCSGVIQVPLPVGSLAVGWLIGLGVANCGIFSSKDRTS